jgi:transcriptional regulator with XRE-family HTH domain
MTPAEVLALRKAHHLTQKQLAAKLGVNPQTVARWEWGIWPITQRTAMQLRGLERELAEKGRAS